MSTSKHRIVEYSRYCSRIIYKFRTLCSVRLNPRPRSRLTSSISNDCSLHVARWSSGSRLRARFPEASPRGSAWGSTIEEAIAHLSLRATSIRGSTSLRELDAGLVDCRLYSVDTLVSVHCRSGCECAPRRAAHEAVMPNWPGGGRARRSGGPEGKQITLVCAARLSRGAARVAQSQADARARRRRSLRMRGEDMENPAQRSRVLPIADLGILGSLESNHITSRRVASSQGDRRTHPQIQIHKRTRVLSRRAARRLFARIREKRRASGESDREALEYWAKVLGAWATRWQAVKHAAPVASRKAVRR